MLNVSESHSMILIFQSLFPSIFMMEEDSD